MDPICYDWRPHKETGTHRGKTMWGHREKTDIYKPIREVTGETSSAGILISDFQPPEPWEKALWFKSSPLLWQPKQTNTAPKMGSPGDGSGGSLSFQTLPTRPHRVWDLPTLELYPKAPLPSFTWISWPPFFSRLCKTAAKLISTSGPLHGSSCYLKTLRDQLLFSSLSLKITFPPTSPTQKSFPDDSQPQLKQVLPTVFMPTLF